MKINDIIREKRLAKGLTQEQIANYQEEIDRLKGLLSQANVDKTNLQSEINLLTTAKTQLEEDNKKLENTISTLKADKIELQNQITDLQAQLKAYEDMNLTDYYKLEFVNSSTDLVVSSLYLKEGGSGTDWHGYRCTGVFLNMPHVLKRSRLSMRFS